ncbi:hypothetical protein MLD38_023123 [Melastoma candidum]|uniref:Uncharacterized protein n=1 Tax=Melastoma candidum TaxID=119954 RepID=A0ACB9QLN9_9MYRT|nr:hypothetical protein MLD38_023123 [Melastoma candidum]
MDQHDIIIPSTHQHAAGDSDPALPAFHHPNGFPTSPTMAPSSDIEMVSFSGTSYISLRDLLPSLASAAPVPFPRPPSYDSAWCEIPIKNPLVKHAAIAYLQPMSSAPAVAEGRGILGAIVDRCAYGCCGVGEDGSCCLWWLGDVFARTARRAGIGWDAPNDNDLGDDDDEDDDGGDD